MDKLDTYRQILRDIVCRHAQYKLSNEHIESLPICDPTSDNYLLLSMGCRTA